MERVESRIEPDAHEPAEAVFKPLSASRRGTNSDATAYASVPARTPLQYVHNPEISITSTSNISSRRVRAIAKFIRPINQVMKLQKNDIKYKEFIDDHNYLTRSKQLLNII